METGDRRLSAVKRGRMASRIRKKYQAIPSMPNATSAWRSPTSRPSIVGVDPSLRGAGLIGWRFALPFIWFLWRGWIGRELAGSLALIFGLGTLQGAVAGGWWLPVCGRTEVSQYRLATHSVAGMSDFCSAGLDRR